MKKLLNLILSISLFGTSTLNSHIIENAKNIINSFTHKNDISWDNADLSKFTIKHIWNINNIENNDININYLDFQNYPVENMQQKIYMALAHEIDHKYDSIEINNFALDFLYDIAENSDLYNTINISILNQSNNSDEDINNNPHSFESFTINSNEIKSFNLRISNKSSTNWNVNKSYFDVSVNICNFDSSRTQPLSSKQDNLNTQMLPDTNLNSIDTEITDYYGNHPSASKSSFQDYIFSHNSSYNKLHKFLSNDMQFSSDYTYNVIPNPYGGGSQTLSKNCTWTQDYNNINTPGHIDLEKICPQFTSVETAKFFLSNISIQSNFSLDDICTPNSNSHHQDKNNEINTFSINEILTYDQITKDSNKSLPWNNLPNTSIKNQNDYYIPDSQYDHQFKKHWFQNEAGHIYYAAFMVLSNSTLNSHTIDALAIFTWQMSGTVYAGINLSFAIHSNEINYNFNDAVFANNQN